MKDRNPTLRPLSAVLSIFHLYYHISGIRNPFFSRNSGSLLTTSRYDPRMERIPWKDGYLLTRILVPWWRGENYFDPVRIEIGSDSVGWGKKMFLVEKRRTRG